MLHVRVGCHPRCLNLCLLFTLILSIAACAGRAPRPAAPEAWKARQQQLAALRSWSLRGRIAIKTDKDGFTAGLRWQQLDDDYEIQISAPFAGGVYELRGSPGGVELKAPDEPARFASDPEALLVGALGWSLPVSDLLYWIRGLPGPGEAIDDLQLDPTGRLAKLQQSGWRIEVDRYSRVGDYELPSKLSLERPPIRVRLVIQKWNQE